MECSHWATPTQTPIKNGFNYNMQNCSHWPTQTLTQMQMGDKPILSVSVSVSVSLSVSVSVSASVNTPLERKGKGHRFQMVHRESNLMFILSSDKCK